MDSWSSTTRDAPRMVFAGFAERAHRHGRQRAFGPSARESGASPRPARSRRPGIARANRGADRLRQPDARSGHRPSARTRSARTRAATTDASAPACRVAQIAGETTRANHQSAVRNARRPLLPSTTMCLWFHVASPEIGSGWHAHVGTRPTLLDHGNRAALHGALFKLLILNDLVGGESGIRTHGRVSPTHAFQACSFNHSDISPRF
jgi:hypothetical protein